MDVRIDLICHHDLQRTFIECLLRAISIRGRGLALAFEPMLLSFLDAGF